MGEIRIYTKLQSENLKKEDLDLDGTIILGCILEKQDGKLWAGFLCTQDRDQWWTFVNTVTNLPFR
jgi:hypothetical protein